MILTQKDIIKKGWNKAETVIIPKGVTSIGKNAFCNCNSLKSITIPDSVISIEPYAFSDCSSLISVIIPDSVTSIGYSAFYGCSSLTSVSIPDSVTSIGDFVFRDCISLTSITIPDSVTSIGECAFRDCNSLTSVSILDSVTSIWNGAFYGCQSLTSVTIPDTVRIIGQLAFAYCDNLTSINIPDSVTSIGKSAFAFCNSLTSVIISNSVTSIGNNAFCGCYNCTITFRNQKYLYLYADLKALNQDNISDFGLKEWVELSSDMLELNIHPFFEKDWAEPSTEEIAKLSEAFKVKFGRAPKVINEIALAQKILKLSTEVIVNNFSVEGFKRALQKSNNNAFIAVVALLGAGKDLLHKFPIATSYEMGVEPLSIRNWIRKHPDSFELLPKLKGMETDIDEDMSVSEVKELLATKRARNDLKKIEADYDFTFANCKCEIEQTEVELEHLTAHLLASSDYRQITVGYDTYCCQHYGSAGETAMMYGLMCPTAGFWVIEDSKGVVKAQAEVWLTENKSTFVFDNIEFANDMEVSDYEDIIKDWAKSCSYPNVVLGMGYTQINLPCPKCDQPDQPMCGELGEDPYTDTHSCICLKKDGELTW